MRRVVIAVALVCAGAAVAGADSSVAAGGERGACSEARGAEILAKLRRRWGRADLELRGCVAGNFGRPGWFVAVAGEKLHRAGIVAAGGGGDIVEFQDVGAMMVATSIVEYRGGDLDGDGVDEIVEWWRKSAHGMMGSDNWLVVRKLDGRTLARIRGPHVGIYWPDMGACSADWTLAPRGLVVKVTSTRGIPPSDCLAPGAHTFRLEKGALVERR